MLLYNELLKLRDKLRDESKAKELPEIICDDELLKLSKTVINNINDLKNYNIEDKYINQFYNLIININDNKHRFLEMNNNVRQTLIELQKKLIDINKRNRMLFIPKLNNNIIDLYKYKDDINNLIFFNKSLNINSNDYLFKEITLLNRDISKNIRDKGINDLYIGYYFIKGKLADDFYINAPLILIPIIIEKRINSFIIKKDNNRDITYNNHLLIANYKIHNVNKKLPNILIEDLNISTFKDDLINFYNDEGISFFALHTAISEFKNVTVDELKYYRNSDYSLEGNIILGRYSSYSTVIERDLREILDENVSTNILNILFDQNSNISNKEINNDLVVNYLGKLNSSQEKVIRDLTYKDALVIEGPPGTGKSQTITSLITSYLLENKSILLVSEKKAALDVVYSRLEELNKYALQIDDINDKDSFYNALKEMLSEDINYNNYDINNLTQINDEINLLFNKFKNIEDTYYKKSKYNTELYNIFRSGKNYDKSNPEDVRLLSLLNENIKNIDINNLDFNNLNNIYQKFNNLELLDKLKIYLDNKDSILNYLKSNLRDLDIIDLRPKLRTISNELKDYKELNAFIKPFNKAKLKKKLVEDLKYYMIDKSYIKFLMNNELRIEDLNNYIDFMTAKDLYNTLDNNEKYYLNILYDINKNIINNILESNKVTYNYIIYNITLFEDNAFKDITNDTYNFDNIIHEIDLLYEKRETIIKNNILANLKHNLDNIKNKENYIEFNHNITSAKRKYNLNRFINKYSDLLDNIKIFLMTPEVVSEAFKIFNKSFDLVIFDEASQIYIEKSIPTIFRAKKLVIAGDTKQLRPSSLGSGRLSYDYDEYDEDNIALEEESLLELAKYKILPPTVLNFHYRSRYEELISFSNYAFYNEELSVAPNINKDFNKAIEVFKINDGIWFNRSNPREALKLVNILKSILKTRKNNESIGIITFNSSQRDLILDTIDSEALKDNEFGELVSKEFSRKENNEDVGLFVKNIENVQGDERDIIIFSIGYAKGENGRINHNFGWLNQKGGENRLNVAITRAKKKIIVITSITPNELHIENSLNKGPKLLKKYLEYCYLISNNDNNRAKIILKSLNNDSVSNDYENIVKEVYEELSKRGFSVELNIGVGRYAIDIAILQNNKYILGIEFDSKLYYDSSDYKERDYFRRKYLESRGWNIYRIFTMNWYRNKKTEINRILNKLYLICKNNNYEI